VALLLSLSQLAMLRGHPKLEAEKSFGVSDITKHPCATGSNLSLL